MGESRKEVKREKEGEGERMGGREREEEEEREKGRRREHRKWGEIINTQRQPPVMCFLLHGSSS